jgi:hypothetical protein
MLGFSAASKLEVPGLNMGQAQLPLIILSQLSFYLKSWLMIFCPLSVTTQQNVILTSHLLVKIPKSSMQLSQNRNDSEHNMYECKIIIMILNYAEFRQGLLF